MGSGSYSFAVYASLASDRGYATKSADAVFTNHSLSAKSDIKLSNVDARTYNTQIKPEMVDTGVTGSMRRTPHEMIKDNFPKLMDALMQLGIKDPQLLFMAVGDHEYDNYPIQVGQFESDTEKIVNSLGIIPKQTHGLKDTRKVIYSPLVMNLTCVTSVDVL